MSQTPDDQARPAVFCPVCGASVVPTAEGLFPPHPNRAGHTCLGPEGRGTEAPAAPPGQQAQGRPPGFPQWIRDAARRPSAGMVAAGLALVLGGPLLSWIGVLVQLQAEVEPVSIGDPGSGSTNQSGTVLLVLGSLAFIAGVVLLCVGVTRLAAKADVAFERSGTKREVDADG
jgi:hypothetical protein